MRPINRHAGYTLIELLLYLSLLSVLLGAIASFTGMVLEARAKNQVMTEVNQQGTAALELISYTLRNASSITAPATGSNASSLTLSVPTASASPTIFTLNDSTLTIKEGSATAVPLTNSRVQVTGLVFTNVSRSGTKGVIQASLTLSYDNNSGRNEYNYQKTFITTVALR